MRIVNSIDDLEDNFSVLHSSVQEGDSTAIDLIRNGKSIVVGSFGGKIAFGPSKFLGYYNNDIKQHIELRPLRDGRKTNPAITKIMSFSKTVNTKAEAAFISYCESLSVTVPANKREYWVLPEAQELVEVELIMNSDLFNHTEKIALIKSRIGQGKFRSQLELKWDNACCITGSKVRSTLRASHIKPWRVCNNKERLDVNNGLLLVANADALFDSGLISFSDNGQLLHSNTVTNDDIKQLLGADDIIIKLNKDQQKYMKHHRKNNNF